MKLAEGCLEGCPRSRNPPGYKTASNSHVVLVEATYSGLLRTRVKNEGARRDGSVYLLLPYAQSQRLCALQYCIRRTYEKTEGS